MPSLYEGFGLLVLEAMACGCAVITSNAGSLAEIAGEIVGPVGMARSDPGTGLGREAGYGTQARSCRGSGMCRARCSPG